MHICSWPHLIGDKAFASIGFLSMASMMIMIIEVFPAVHVVSMFSFLLLSPQISSL